MKLTFTPFELQLKHRFTIAKFSRTATPLMLVQLEHEGHIGYGEASMVPYMGESVETATDFLNKIDVNELKYRFNYAEIMAYLDSLAPDNPAIKAAIDIALHDLEGKLLNQPCWQLLGSNPELMPVTSYTIGIDTPEIFAQKVHDAAGYKAIKIKLGSDNDKKLIETVRSITQVPLYVDANQGWSNREQSLDLIYWLYEQGVQLIEQPMVKTDPDSNAWLTARSPIPIVGDEAVQRLADVERASGVYHGINIKLMKSAGMYEAKLMIDKARQLGLKILIGCMSETSCATLAAAALAPQCDWADLDGPLLTSNNPFNIPDMEDGKWVLIDMAGLGLVDMEHSFNNIVL
ncbi:dipeptide epimerase [Mucilaginibacter terrae]|uniref:dipeptide epimerase n=1 Tax=Mucilaginibacter terrae TaxID=1955052 RepID=UPI003632BFFB